MSLFIFCIPLRLPCSRIFHASGMIFLLFHSLTFPNRLFPKHDPFSFQGTLLSFSWPVLQADPFQKTMEWLSSLCCRWFQNWTSQFTVNIRFFRWDVHVSIHKFLSSERAAALEHLKVLEDMGIHTDSIIILTEAIILKICSVTVSNMAISVSWDSKNVSIFQKVIEKLYKEAVRCRSQILPGRSFPRKK